MTRNASKMIAISLYDEDVANLHQIGKDVGVTSRSGTIRFLIKYFQRAETERQHLIRENAATYAAEMDEEPCISLT